VVGSTSGTLFQVSFGPAAIMAIGTTWVEMLGASGFGIVIVLTMADMLWFVAGSVSCDFGGWGGCRFLAASHPVKAIPLQF
jgi:hypothetical protein